jgi:preprotein translocase subunit SecY
MADKDLSESPVKELARRFLITFLLGVVVYRLGIYVPIPGIMVQSLKDIIQKSTGGGGLGTLLQYANMFNGGAVAQASIFGLGITPYISASIIIQLLAFSIPTLKQLQKEGESGRRKINQYTRYATLLICLVQSAIAATAALKFSTGDHILVDRNVPPLVFVLQSVVVITTGSMLLLWIAEQITRYGIGNGVSVVIMVGILAYLPTAFQGFGGDLPKYLGVFLVAMVIIAAIVVVVQAVRRIHLEQQRRVQGNKVYGGQQTTLPLKLNQANVIPVIFASPVMVVLGLLAGKLGANIGLGELFSYGQPMHRYLFAGLIVAFTYFYISVTFDLFDLSNHFKTAGFFVRGIRPGKNTVDHLATILKRITFVGAIFLAVIATLPEMIGRSTLGLNASGSAVLLGGTGLMIVVGVSLDVMQKVSAFFLAHQYRGLSGGDGGALGMRKPGKRF